MIAPLTRGFGHMQSVARQVARLGQAAQTAVVKPDQAALKAIGRNVLDPARRPPAARAGHAQAAAEAERVAAVWAAARSGGSSSRRSGGWSAESSEPGPAGGRARLADGLIQVIRQTA